LTKFLCSKGWRCAADEVENGMDEGMTRQYRFGAFATLLLGALLAGCASEPASVEDRTLEAQRPVPVERRPTASPREASGGTYRVVRGDTLYSIAFKRGLDFRDVANWNGIGPPYKILVDQDLRLSPPGGSPRVVEPVVATSSKPIAASAPSASSPPAASTSPVNKTAQSGSMFEDVTSEPPPTVPPPASTSSAPVASASPTPVPAPVPTPAPLAVPVTPPVEAPPKPVIAMPATPKPVEEGIINNAGGLAWRWPNSGKVIGGFVGGDQTKQGVDIAGSAGDPVTAAADGEVVYSGNGLLGYGELIIVKHNASFLSAYGHNRKRLVSEGDKVKGGQQIAEMGSSASSRDELHFEIRKNGKPVNPLDYLPPR
jgi:lipoprotein NlpD